MKKNRRNAAIAADRTAFTRDVRDRYLAGELEPKRTQSGLGYVIHETGEGKAPRPGKEVSVHYLGMLASDGAVFDESFSRGKPFIFRLGAGEVIAGWDEGIDLLSVGDTATLFIPARLGYGTRGAGRDVPPHSELIFYVEVVHAD